MANKNRARNAGKKDPTIASSGRVATLTDLLTRANVLSQFTPAATATTDVFTRAHAMSESARRASTLAGAISRRNALSESVRGATAMTELLRRTNVLSESMRRASAFADLISRTNALSESVRGTTTTSELFRRPEVLSESLQRANTFADLISRTNALSESVRGATAMTELLSRAKVISEPIWRAASESKAFRAASILSDFGSLGMATAASAVAATSAAAFASMWQSPKISVFTERFVQDADFSRGLFSRLEKWKFEDLQDDLPQGEAVLAAIEEAIDEAGVADRQMDSGTIATKLVEFWSRLSPEFRHCISTFIVGVVLLIIQYSVFDPRHHSREAPAQQTVRDRRKLATYATKELGARTQDYRVVSAPNVPVYAGHRRDAPRSAELDVGQAVQVVQQKRNWCEVIWLGYNGSTRGGWVQTRYLRRL